MTNVDLTQVRAMLREIVATSGDDSCVVHEVMAIGAEGAKTIGLSTATLSELDEIVGAVSGAKVIDGKVMSLRDTDWQKLEDLYYRKVVQPLFA